MFTVVIFFGLIFVVIILQNLFLNIIYTWIILDVIIEIVIFSFRFIIFIEFLSVRGWVSVKFSQCWCVRRDYCKCIGELLHCPNNKAEFRENKGRSTLEGKFSSNPWKWWLLSQNYWDIFPTADFLLFTHENLPDFRDSVVPVTPPVSFGLTLGLYNNNKKTDLESRSLETMTSTQGSAMGRKRHSIPNLAGRSSKPGRFVTEQMWNLGTVHCQSDRRTIWKKK